MLVKAGDLVIFCINEQDSNAGNFPTLRACLTAKPSRALPSPFPKASKKTASLLTRNADTGYLGNRLKSSADSSWKSNSAVLSVTKPRMFVGASESTKTWVVDLPNSWFCEVYRRKKSSRTGTLQRKVLRSWTVLSHF